MNENSSDNDDYINVLIHNLTTNKSIRELNLVNRLLRQLPSEFYRFGKRLRSLYLDNNKLIVVPKEIGLHFQNLETLTLENNEITLLPEETFAYFNSLKYLNLNFNHLTCLNPIIVKKFTKLTHLWLNNCELMNLPKEIGELTHLRIFGLKANYLSQMPSEIGNMKSLTWLNIEHNNLENLPSSIQNLRNLNYLNLNENAFSRIPTVLYCLNKTLNYLLMRKNLIQDFSDENIIELYLIQTIDLRCNPFIDTLKTDDTFNFNKLKSIDNFILTDSSDVGCWRLKVFLKASHRCNSSGFFDCLKETEGRRRFNFEIFLKKDAVQVI